METYNINGVPSFGLYGRKGEQGQTGNSIFYKESSTAKENDLIIYKNGTYYSLGILSKSLEKTNLFNFDFSKKPDYDIEIQDSSIIFTLNEPRQFDLYICYKNSENNYQQDLLKSTSNSNTYAFPEKIFDNNKHIVSDYSIYLDYYETNYYPQRIKKYLVYTKKVSQD